jgi:bis(5'-nucleosyl)-tetraphosphatase (symmetrical)
MSKYAIGDIQGCYDQFQQLLSLIQYNKSTDTLYLVGDIINRGPKSLQTLQWIYKNQDNIKLVLGNHDIFLIGCFVKLLSPKKHDTINDILSDPSATKLIDYLRHQSLICADAQYVVVHAGIHPQLPITTLLDLNNEFMNKLSGKNYHQFIADIYNDNPRHWDVNKLSRIEQLTFFVNSTTRMRFLERDTLALNYTYKGNLTDCPKNLTPWFNVDRKYKLDQKIICGHWSALGFLHTQKLVALDTGCVWGNKLTAFNTETSEIIQITNND